MKLVYTHEVGAWSHFDAVTVGKVFTLVLLAAASWATDKLRPAHVERVPVAFELHVQGAHVHPESDWRRTGVTEVHRVLDCEKGNENFHHECS